MEKQLALLDPFEALPNATRGWARLRERDRRFRVIRRNWIWGTAVATIACFVLVALPEKSVCCARTVVEQNVVEELPVPAALSEPAPAPAPPAAAPALAVKPDPVVAVPRYKDSGSPSAPITIEIYTDFSCPACAMFYRDTYPQLAARYVETGKVRIVHRDFPLPQHAYAKLAARYANAAGELGVYEVVFNRLFETQAEWSANGNIEGALKPVLTPELMGKLQRLLVTGKNESMTLDQLRGVADALNQTPTLIVVTPDGQRHKLAGAQPFITLSAYLDELEPRR